MRARSLDSPPSKSARLVGAVHAICPHDAAFLRGHCRKRSRRLRAMPLRVSAPLSAIRLKGTLCPVPWRMRNRNAGRSSPSEAGNAGRAIHARTMERGVFIKGTLPQPVGREVGLPTRQICVIEAPEDFHSLSEVRAG